MAAKRLSSSEFAQIARDRAKANGLNLAPGDIQAAEILYRAQNIHPTVNEGIRRLAKDLKETPEAVLETAIKIGVVYSDRCQLEKSNGTASDAVMGMEAVVKAVEEILEQFDNLSGAISELGPQVVQFLSVAMKSEILPGESLLPEDLRIRLDDLSKSAKSVAKMVKLTGGRQLNKNFLGCYNRTADRYLAESCVEYTNGIAEGEKAPAWKLAQIVIAIKEGKKLDVDQKQGRFRYTKQAFRQMVDAVFKDEAESRVV